MLKPLHITLIFTLITSFAVAQDFQYGQFKQAELEMKSYAKDTSAHAVVLNEYGRSEIVPTNDDYIRLIFLYHVKIKIFDSQAFKEGNIEIPIYSGDGQTYEEVEEVKGITTYKDDNGNVKTVQFDPEKVYTEKNTKHWSKVKFAMPAMRNGCIIEFVYRLRSPYVEQFQPWKFQSDIPKVYSEYDIHIPAFWVYNASIRGYLKTTKNVSEVEHDCFQVGAAKSDCSHFIYGMSDIPAFINDEYMTSEKNYLSAIYFELSEYTNPFTGGKTKVAKEWSDVDYELKHYDGFGGQLKRKSLLQERIAPVIAGKTDDLQKAKAVYAYITKTMKWNEYYGFESVDGIKKALDSHSGSAGDINLALTTALTSAGLNAQAVLLSTRDHGVVNQLYPVVTEFDYVVSKVDIGDKSYLLDATDPLLAFGMLPLRCLNDQGRVMSLDKPSYWIDMDTFTKQRENDTYVCDLALDVDGKIKGTMTHFSSGYAAYRKRKAIKKFNSIDEYVENLDEKTGNVKILGSDITNVDSLDLPLSEKYTIEIKGYKNTDHERLLFNPFMFEKINTNPFKLNNRTYPVDWGMPSATRFTLTMHLPEGYSVEGPPQNATMSLPANGGSFITNFDATGNVFTFAHIIQFNKSIYSVEEYPYLKEFYNKIILSEKADLVLKKKDK